MSIMTPLEIHIPLSTIDALRDRLISARWAKLPLGEEWEAGISRDFLQEIAAAWLDFDWRRVEHRINSYSNALIDIEGQSVHVLHQRSVDSKAVPLLLIHGWPGSFLEFIDVIEPLTAAGETAFHVVCPSIPGFGFSGQPNKPGMNVERVAELFVTLMERLGYHKFYVQGGDWGAMIASQIARQFPQRCLGLHLNMLVAPPPQIPDPLGLVQPNELSWLQKTEGLWRTGMGYYAIQRTRPHSLAYALSDSPLGLAAWLGEKFMLWSDSGPNHRLGIPMEALLAHLSLYWFTETIGSSMRLYYEEAQCEPKTEYVSVPTGAAIFPAEMARTPRQWAQLSFNVVHWQQYERGGHFAAMEVPDCLVADVRRFVQTVRQQRG